MTSSLCPAQRDDRTSDITHSWSACLEKHHGLLGFSSNTWWPHSLLLWSHTSEAGASSCISSGGLSTPSKGQCLADYRTTIAKKSNPPFCERLSPFDQWELPRYHWLLSVTFHVKRNFPHSANISSPPERHFLLKLTMKKGRFVRPLPFWI